MKRKMQILSFSWFLLISLSFNLAPGQDFPDAGQSPLALSTHCYELYQEDVPDGHERVEAQSKNLWCYAQIATPDGQVDQLVFRPIGFEVKPELSFLVDQENMITHGSLLNGEV